jgi:hypothetical protein
MPQPRPARWCLLTIALIGAALVALTTAQLVAAAPINPQSSGPEKCATCHRAETEDWQYSPHAQAIDPIDHDALVKECNSAEGEDCSCLSCHTTNFDATTTHFTAAGVTCEACHGAYVEGHPENGVMQLSVDSSVCSTCHVDTHEDWAQTPHAQAGVQCIGCHRSHSQDLRLQDEALCISCHRDRLEDPGHAAHTRTGINCIDCHTAPSATRGVAQDIAQGGNAPAHDFTVVTAVCTDCHQDMFHDAAASAAQPTTRDLSSAAVIPSDEVAAAVVEQEARSWLQAATAISFGLGLGIGAMFGIVFILIVAFIYQRQRSA